LNKKFLIIRTAGCRRPGRKIDVDPETGENLEKLAKQILQQPPEVLAGVKKILGN
jgi:hypothetical protein